MMQRLCKEVSGMANEDDFIEALESWVWSGDDYFWDDLAKAASEEA